MIKKIGLVGLAAVLLAGPVVLWSVKGAAVRSVRHEPANEQLKPAAELPAVLTKAAELEKQGKLKEAIGHFERALALTPQVYGEYSLETYHARIAVAFRYQALGRYVEAANLHHRSSSAFSNADEALQYKYARWRYLRLQLGESARQPPAARALAPLPTQLQAMRQEAEQLDGELKRIRDFDRLVGLEYAEEKTGDRALTP